MRILGRGRLAARGRHPARCWMLWCSRSGLGLRGATAQAYSPGLADVGATLRGARVRCRRQRLGTPAESADDRHRAVPDGDHAGPVAAGAARPAPTVARLAVTRTHEGQHQPASTRPAAASRASCTVRLQLTVAHGTGTARITAGSTTRHVARGDSEDRPRRARRRRPAAAHASSPGRAPPARDDERARLSSNHRRSRPSVLETRWRSIAADLLSAVA